jgi:hypothetical protein
MGPRAGLGACEKRKSFIPAGGSDHVSSNYSNISPRPKAPPAVPWQIRPHQPPRDNALYC